MTPFDPAVLPVGFHSRILPGVNGLSVHVLEAGKAGQPAVLLLHGFPELAFSWRKVMPALADAGITLLLRTSGDTGVPRAGTQATMNR